MIRPGHLIRCGVPQALIYPTSCFSVGNGVVDSSFTFALYLGFSFLFFFFHWSGCTVIQTTSIYLTGIVLNLFCFELGGILRNLLPGSSAHFPPQLSKEIQFEIARAYDHFCTTTPPRLNSGISPRVSCRSWSSLLGNVVINTHARFRLSGVEAATNP